MINRDEESGREFGESSLCLLRFDDFSAEEFETGTSGLISPITRWIFQLYRTDLHRVIYLDTFVDKRIACDMLWVTQVSVQ